MSTRIEHLIEFLIIRHDVRTSTLLSVGDFEHGLQRLAQPHDAHVFQQADDESDVRPSLFPFSPVHVPLLLYLCIMIVLTTSYSVRISAASVTVSSIAII